MKFLRLIMVCLCICCSPYSSLSSAHEERYSSLSSVHEERCYRHIIVAYKPDPLEEAIKQMRDVPSPCLVRSDFGVWFESHSRLADDVEGALKDVKRVDPALVRELISDRLVGGHRGLLEWSEIFTKGTILPNTLRAQLECLHKELEAKEMPKIQEPDRDSPGN